MSPKAICAALSPAADVAVDAGPGGGAFEVVIVVDVAHDLGVPLVDLIWIEDTADHDAAAALDSRALRLAHATRRHVGIGELGHRPTGGVLGANRGHLISKRLARAPEPTFQIGHLMAQLALCRDDGAWHIMHPWFHRRYSL